MSLSSDITIDTSAFSQEPVTEETIKVNDILENLTTQRPRWYEVGPARYREMAEAGETSFPPPPNLPGAKDTAIPSRDQHRAIPLRVYTPGNGEPSKGIFLQIHGGGFTIMSHRGQDALLQRYANACQLTAISVGYRLAPEHPWPAAIHDCFDAAEYLVENSQSVYSAPPVLFISGESAGSCLAVQTAFHLLRTRPQARILGTVFPYGQFDVTLNLPSMTSSTRPLLINYDIMRRFAECYTPGMSIEERRNPLISPLYDDLHALAKAAPGNKLPPALFLCGTKDPLLDDTLLMSTKWMATGSEAIVKIYPEAPHGFTLMPGYTLSEDASAIALEFVKRKLDGVATDA
ncbi:acetyl esterase [Podospora australis]|uniref:Acetyl esterase n=1 Tax=Podospora australis TaxID=1536484 RepID=A0AAN7AGM3_9PEZI|nr:acetyl esterase [Podospora australis]